jgi:AcrR family transcriptional regulator
MSLATCRPGGGAQRTRAAILASARQAFSTKGYSATGVREITAAACVNPALVSRYFGSKEKLFDETLRDMLDVSVLTGVAREDFGEHMVQILTGERGADRNPLPMMVLASTDPVSRGICADLLRRLVAAPLAAWLGEPDASARVARFVMLASGLTIHRSHPSRRLQTLVMPPLDESSKSRMSAPFTHLRRCGQPVGEWLL